MTPTLKKLSSTYNAQAEMGAQFGDREGWQVALRFQTADAEADAISNGVGLADVSYIQKFDLKADSSDSQIPEFFAAHTRQLARRHWLVTSSWDESGQFSDTDSAGSSAEGISMTDVTSAYAAFLLIGPQSRAVIQKLSSLDVSDSGLSNQATAQTSLAKAHCILTRDDIAEVPTFLIMIGREYGEFVWKTVLDAGQEFGIVPVGIEALKKLKG